MNAAYEDGTQVEPMDACLDVACALEEAMSSGAVFGPLSAWCSRAEYDSPDSVLLYDAAGEVAFRLRIEDVEA